MNEKIKFITSVFGKSRLQNNGIELMIPCPFCKDPKKLKMNIRLDSELYHCWVCNNKGRRAIIPSFDMEGDLNYFVTRAIDDTPYTYINAKANKRHIIFNDIDIDWDASTLTIVEGPLDWMKCRRINAVCILGSSLTEDSILFQKLVRSSMDVILSLDPDAYHKQLRIATLLASYDLNVSLASPSEGDLGDMDEYSVEHLMSTAVEYNNELGSLPFLINKL